jgi:methanogenic corrinoid protein MtbC1
MNKKTELPRLVADLEEDAVLDIVQQRIKAGEDLLQIIDECNQGMREVGLRYEIGEYFIAGLIMSGEIFRQVVEMTQPLLLEQLNRKSSGKILVVTVSGDIHDLGKNIFGLLLSCHGFDVIDLGVDVPPAELTARVSEIKPDLVGLSSLITASFEMMKVTITLLRSEYKKHGFVIPILIGGGFVNDQIHQYVGSDYWVPDAMAGVRLCEELLGKNR